MKTQDKMHHISTFIVYQERKKTAPNVRLKKYRKKLQSTDSQLPSGIQNPTHRMRSTRKLFYAWEKCLRNIFSLKKLSPPGCCSFRTAGFFYFSCGCSVSCSVAASAAVANPTHSKLIPEGRPSNSAHPESKSASRHKRLHFTTSTRRKQGCAPQPRKFELPFHRSAGRSGTLPDTNRNTLHRQQRHLCTPDGDSSLLILNFVA